MMKSSVESKMALYSKGSSLKILIMINTEGLGSKMTGWSILITNRTKIEALVKHGL